MSDTKDIFETDFSGESLDEFYAGHYAAEDVEMDVVIAPPAAERTAKEKAEIKETVRRMKFTLQEAARISVWAGDAACSDDIELYYEPWDENAEPIETISEKRIRRLSAQALCETCVVEPQCNLKIKHG